MARHFRIFAAEYEGLSRCPVLTLDSVRGDAVRIGIDQKPHYGLTKSRQCPTSPHTPPDPL
jgi:hypothetical protein